VELPTLWMARGYPATRARRGVLPDVDRLGAEALLLTSPLSDVPLDEFLCH
jgi:hypothetical protein